MKLIFTNFPKLNFRNINLKEICFSNFRKMQKNAIFIFQNINFLNYTFYTRIKTQFETEFKLESEFEFKTQFETEFDFNLKLKLCFNVKFKSNWNVTHKFQFKLLT